MDRGFVEVMIAASYSGILYCFIKRSLFSEGSSGRLSRMCSIQLSSIFTGTSSCFSIQFLYQTLSVPSAGQKHWHRNENSLFPYPPYRSPDIGEWREVPLNNHPPPEEIECRVHLQSPPRDLLSG